MEVMMSESQGALLTRAEEDPDPLLTRAELAQYLTGLGYKIKLGYLHQLCSEGKGPKPDVLWGERKLPLYKRRTGRGWAQARCSVPA
jgi:hypothetical protein